MTRTSLPTRSASTPRPARRALPAAVLLACLAAGLAGPPAAAQELNRLGVYDAIELAHVRNPALNDARTRLTALDGEWWRSFGLQAPSLTFFREGIPTGAGHGFVEQRWALSQAIDFPLRSYYRLRRVGTEQDALTLSLQAASKQLTADVKKAYTDLLYAQELMHLRAEEVTLARQLLDGATVRVEVGEASELEQMKAELQLAEAQSKQETAYLAFENARYALFRIVGIDPEDQLYQIAFPDTLAYIDADIDQDRIMAALTAQPEARSAARRLDAARLGVRQTRSSLLPDLTVDLYAQDYGTGFEQVGFQIGLRLPLWVVPNYRGDLRAARAEVQARTWQQEAVALDLKQEAEEAWHGYETSKRTIDRYRTNVQARSNELLRLTLEGYRIGELDLLTLLDTQRTYLANQERYYEALRDYYHRLIDLERFIDADIAFNTDRIAGF